MNVSNGRVEAVSTKPVETRYGTKNTYSIKVDGKWYKCAFKDPKLASGDVVSFEYTPGKYGDEVNTATIKKETGAVPTPAAPAGAEPAPRFNSARHGAFPIPALDGQRSIVRQNALTNAREMVVAAMCQGQKTVALDIDTHSALVINLAKKFEAYTAGDMDLEVAKASLEADAEVKH